MTTWIGPLQFVCYLHFVGWDCWSFGAHVCTSLPNIELHLPFCFIRVGWVRACVYDPTRPRRSFGILDR